MENDLPLLIDESIALELNISELYTLFYETFSEDADFWWKLAMEEKNHGALIKSGRDYYKPVGSFPADLVSTRLEELKDANQRVASLIDTYRKTPPSRETAFRVALEIEQSSGEIHFQRFMKNEPASTIDDIFHQLNKNDKDHASRLRSYMKDHGIQI